MGIVFEDGKWILMEWDEPERGVIVTTGKLAPELQEFVDKYNKPA